MTTYPSVGDYTSALQNPAAVFSHPSLRKARFTQGFGGPFCASGTSAVVFQARVDDKLQALRCYLRDDAATPERYAALDQFVAGSRLGQFIGTVTWYREEVRVNGARWPVLEMDWIEGQHLNNYAGFLAEAENTTALGGLAGHWLEMVNGLQGARFAHGDLQHGNVLVDTGRPAAAGGLRQRVASRAARTGSTGREWPFQLPAARPDRGRPVGSLHGHLRRARRLPGANRAYQAAAAVGKVQQRRQHLVRTRRLRATARHRRLAQHRRARRLRGRPDGRQGQRVLRSRLEAGQDARGDACPQAPVVGERRDGGCPGPESRRGLGPGRAACCARRDGHLAAAAHEVLPEPGREPGRQRQVRRRGAGQRLPGPARRAARTG